MNLPSKLIHDHISVSTPYAMVALLFLQDKKKHFFETGRWKAFIITFEYRKFRKR